MKKEKNKKKPNRKLGSLLRFFGIADAYFAAMVLAVVFALFCSGRVGWFLLLVMILAPVCSLIWTGVSIAQMRISITSKDNLLERGDKSQIAIDISSKFFVLPPEITIVLEDNGHISPIFEEGRNEIHVFPSFASGREQVVEYTAAYAGLAAIGIREIVVTDIFGVFSIKVKPEKLAKIAPEVCNIEILPRNGLLQKEDEWLLQAREAAFDGEEPESSLDDLNYTFGGFPGYEHREYRPGDPLKRINYKLSSRMRELYVRLDEKQAVAGISVSLVNFSPKICVDSESLDDELLTKNQEMINAQAAVVSACLEEMLAVIKYLFLHDFAVTAYFPYSHLEKGEQTEYVISNDMDIEAVRKALAKVSFSDENIAVNLPQKGSVILFAAYSDARVYENIAEFSKIEGNTVTMYISSTEEGGRL